MKMARVVFLAAALVLSGVAAQAVTLQADGSPTTGDPNLRLWLDASDLGTLFQDTAGTSPVTATGQQVALWADKSGNGLNVSQTSAGDRPDYTASVAELNGCAALYFEGNAGGDDLEASNNTGITGNADLTVITVWANRVNTGQNFQHAFHMGTTTAEGEAYGISVARNTSDRIGNHYWYSGFDSSASSTADGMMAVATWDGDGGTAGNGLDSWYVDGKFAGANDRGPLNIGPDQLRIGSRLSGPTEGIQGDIAEVIIYDTALTWEQQDRLGKHLADKYGIDTAYQGTGNLYGVNTTGLTWVDARAAAQAMTPPTGYNRGDLVSITSAAENEAVLSRITTSTWIGANDTAIEGEWVWSDGTGQFWQGKGSAAGGTPVGGMYTNWSGTSEPNDAGGEDAGCMYTSGLWNDLPAASASFLRQSMVEFTPNTTRQDFDTGTTPYTASTFGSGTGPVVQSTDATSNYIRLLHNTGSQQNVIAFDRTATEAWQNITATFDFRIDPGADGMGFALLNTANFGTTGAGPAIGAWEETNIARSFGLGFDIYSGIHEVSLHWNGKVVATDNSFDYRTGSTGAFNNVQLSVDYLPRGANVSVSIAGNPIFTDYFIEGMYPYESRAAFGARTGGAFTTLDVDNIQVAYDTLWHSHVWNGGTGSYTDASQWNVGTVPTAADNALIPAGQANGTLAINGPGTLTVAGTGRLENSGTLWVGQAAASDGVLVLEDGNIHASTLYLGGDATARGTFIMTGGQVDLDSYMVVGTGGTGIVHQSGGTVNQPNAKLILGDAPGSTGNVYNLTGGAVNANQLSLGDKATTSGTFNVAGGTLTTKSELYVGLGGTGTLNHTGGTVNANNWLILGQNGGATGVYNISGNSVLNVGGSYFIIGRSGVGTVNQSGNSVVNVNVGSRFMVCDFGGSAGSAYNMSGGTLNINGGKLMAIGKGDTGEFLQTGGTVNASGDLSLGESGTGTYKLRGGILDLTGSIINNNGTGRLEFDGGTLNVGGNIDVDSLRMAVTGSANPTLTLGAGQTLTVRGTMTVGENNQATVGLTDVTTIVNGNLRIAPYAGGNGSVLQDGGSMTVGGRLELADNGSAQASYTLSGDGTLSVGGDYLIVGRLGPGTFTQSGTSVVNANMWNRLLIGDCGGTDGSSYTLHGGTLNINNGKEMSIGKHGDAEFYQDGGLVNATGNIRLGEDAGYTGTYTLAGGTLDLNGRDVFIGNGDGVFNFTGGRLLDAGTVGFDLTNDGGIIAPGASPGATTINGAYLQTADGVYQVELGGTGIGAYDQILVSGPATVSGLLEVANWGGFEPHFGDVFDVIIAADGITALESLSINYSGPFPFEWDVVDVTGGEALRLTYTPEPTTFALLGIGFAAALRRRRRTR